MMATNTAPTKERVRKSLDDFLNLSAAETRKVYARYFSGTIPSVQQIREAVIERYYPERVGYCRHCSTKTTYKHDERRYLMFCCDNCKNSSQYVRDAIRDTYLTRYGMTQQEFLARPEVVIARNCAHASKATKQKRRRTMLERFGVVNIAQSPDIQDRIRATNQLRYGADQHMQSAEHYDRWVQNVFRKAGYLTQDGRTLHLQGHEPYVADALEQLGWSVRKPVRGLKYYWNRKQRVYHPDFVITKRAKQLLVEVKSIYTLFADDSYERNAAKFKAADVESQNRFVLAVAFPKSSEMILIHRPSRFSKSLLMKLISGEREHSAVRRIACP